MTTDFDFVYRIILNKADEVEALWRSIDAELVAAGILKPWADISVEDKNAGEKYKRADVIRDYSPEYAKVSDDFVALQNEWREFLDESDPEGEEVMTLNYLGDSF